MSAALFSAGLGDVIRTCYQSRAYRAISEAESPVRVIVASHNPFTIEIFRHHRNAKNFILYDLGHKYDEYLAAGLRGVELNRAICEFAGVDHASLIRGSANNYVPTFDAPDTIASEGHIVFQPFAGNASYRSLPSSVAGDIASVLKSLPWPTFILTRSYPRTGIGGKSIHSVEDARAYAGGAVTVLDHLSTPAALNLIKTCRAYVGSWSSLQQAAWFEHKPVAVFYPENYVDVTDRTPYAFGMDRQNTLGRDFPKADMAELETFLRNW